jgi:hypothetical protein
MLSAFGILLVEKNKKIIKIPIDIAKSEKNEII